MAGMNLPDVRYELIRLQGGMDQVTPTLSLKPGVTRRAANFECSITGGYTRVEGYERFDGRPSPSAAGYLVIYVPNSFSVSVGNTVTGGTSAATGKVIAVTQTYLVVTKVVGTFAEIENIYVGATLIGESTATAGAVTDPSLDSGYRNLAADEYRGDIAAVPGEGPIRGVAYYKDTVYAWRDYSVGVPGTLFLRMYKSSSSGWTVVPLGVELSFDGGTGEILDGQTVTGATSGATATVKRVVLQDGDWSTSDASGRLIFAAVTGTFQNNENLQVGGVTKALANGTQSNIEMTIWPLRRARSIRPL